MEPDFNVGLFEKKLANLKDSQESINSMSAWCLENRQHHKKIVSAWLNVLKRVKIEHRLTLFYLANDVIQYSKRKNYEFVESWGTTLQKATTMVREEKVKHRVLRIFKIWEQRGIYGEEFLSDLSGLISVAPVKKIEQDPMEFQPSYLISKIQACSKLEDDTDVKLKKMKENELKYQWDDSEAVVSSLKDRQRVEDVEKEVEDGIKLADQVIFALNAEIKARKHLLSLLSQAESFYRTQKGEVKVVSNAYKSFGGRVKNLKKRLDEMKQDESRWGSPIPSPDVNAPSPGPDSDIELPGQDDTNPGCNYTMDQSYAANFYTPVADQATAFTNNGFSSFMGSNISFDIHANLFNDSNTPSHVSDTNSTNNLIEVVGNQKAPSQAEGFSINNIIKQLLPTSVTQHTTESNIHMTYSTPSAPLLPPPMPPFTSPSTTYAPTNSVSYTDPVYPPSTESYTVNTTQNYQQQLPTAYMNTVDVPPPYPVADEYNPEEELETWDNEGVWPEPDMETPESPPIYEKEAVTEPVEYHDVGASSHPIISQEDVDHRVLLPPPHLPPHLAEIKGPDTDHRISRTSNKDIDHRNLISLTGSPGPDGRSTSSVPPPPLPPPLWNTNADQDYRGVAKDQDYRGPPPLMNPPPLMQQFVQLAAEPPPPPPPLSVASQVSKSNKRPPLLRRPLDITIISQDNVESIDMDLSDDDGVHSVPKPLLNNDDFQKNHKFNSPQEQMDRTSQTSHTNNTHKRSLLGASPFDQTSPRKRHNHLQLASLVGSPTLAPLESPVLLTLDDDADATANNIIETIARDDFLDSLQDMDSDMELLEKRTQFMSNVGMVKDPNRQWYQNEWTEDPVPFQALPEFARPHEFRGPPEFHPRPAFQLAHAFRGAVIAPFPGAAATRIDPFRMPLEQFPGDFRERTHFRGGRGRVWGKTQPVNRGNRGGANRGFPRGRGGAGFRGRGGNRGGFREQW